jgi:hypothetical protein
MEVAHAGNGAAEDPPPIPCGKLPSAGTANENDLLRAGSSAGTKVAFKEPINGELYED